MDTHIRYITLKVTCTSLLSSRSPVTRQIVDDYKVTVCKEKSEYFTKNIFNNLLN